VVINNNIVYDIAAMCNMYNLTIKNVTDLPACKLKDIILFSFRSLGFCHICYFLYVCVFIFYCFIVLPCAY